MTALFALRFSRNAGFAAESPGISASLAPPRDRHHGCGKDHGCWAAKGSGLVCHGLTDDLIRICDKRDLVLYSARSILRICSVMNRKSRSDFTIFDREPLMRALINLSGTPVRLGIGSFIVLSLVLCLWAGLKPVPVDAKNYLTFFESISWSLSVLFIFPIGIPLILIFYQIVPPLFDHLICEAEAAGSDPKLLDSYLAALKRRFDSYSLSSAFFATSLILNAIYFYQILNKVGPLTWMTDGVLFSSLSAHGRGFSHVGLYAAVVQIILFYGALHLFWRGLILGWGLFEFFNRRGFKIRLEPLHPDGCCGLGEIGKVTLILNATIFLLGLYVSLKVIDRIVIQQAPLGEDIGNPLILGIYAILAPTIFFLPLLAAHGRMQEAKIDFLLPISRRCESQIAQLGKREFLNQMPTIIQSIGEVEKIRDRMKKEIPVWPLEFRSFGAFFGTVIVPVLPVILPFLLRSTLS